MMTWATWTQGGIQGSTKPKVKPPSQEGSLLQSVFQNDSPTIAQGRLLKQALNMGQHTLNPEQIFESLVKDYHTAERLYGRGLIRLITGHSTEYVKRNIRIPEFRKVLYARIKGLQAQLKSNGYVDSEGVISELGMKLAGLLLYIEELEESIPKGQLSGRYTKDKSPYGDPENRKQFSRSTRFRDLSVRDTVKLATRRLHKTIHEKDLVARERKRSTKKWVVFVLDASGSMRESKIDYAKKAGVALAYKTIDEGNRIGLVVFSSNVVQRLEPTKDFPSVLSCITKISPRNATNIAEAIRSATELFPKGRNTKHIIAITDALPTSGKWPVTDTLAEVAKARAAGITLSLVGIKLNPDGERLANRIVELGGGKLYAIKEFKNLDRIVLLDYYAL